MTKTAEERYRECGINQLEPNQDGSDFHIMTAIDLQMIAEQRANVVRIALEWERTPYIHQGRIKGKAADCTFFAKVYEEAGLLPPITIPPYSHQAHLNRQGAMYLPIIERHAKREIELEQSGPGDIVMYFIARSWSHGAVILDPGFPRIIHADMAARHVIIGEGDQGFFKNVKRRFFSWW